MEKIDARKLSTEAQQQIRNQSIRLRKHGKTYKEISEITCVHQNTIARWCKDYQHKGIGTYLFRRLVDIARDRGITQFTADVIAGNSGMIQLFHKCATGPVHTTLDEGSYHLSFEIR